MIGVGDRFTALPFSLLLLAVEFVLVAVLRPSEGFGVFAPLVLLKCLRDCLIAVLFALLMRGAVVCPALLLGLSYVPFSGTFRFETHMAATPCCIAGNPVNRHSKALYEPCNTMQHVAPLEPIRIYAVGGGFFQAESAPLRGRSRCPFTLHSDSNASNHT
ncbi:hypothetical protein PP633_22010 [Mycobacteroides abscessus]|uniref:Uncharacterized protein n=1 Tax=Mycobacteroides abscessus subsp. massiliense TaxID=1962118 RepID=A0A1U1B5J5_9MYCO|nr:hypothetical protein [Mycobacteroides abscessus]EIU03660.1 hypothetical protein MA5S0422_5524 [Mycobacteroides abscessus 5S-0422]MBN7315982.1 hypothetical protein [Mycobacteroides abscessus subsp. massiliense]MDM2646323.1 hypothetical protein [Mycobacteroides abscessus]MDM2655210.1 hypothetical protein [Mycobacteroides abscessus]MDM2665008.1 hypothetical protein [Mycobacteroides abscessus]